MLEFIQSLKQRYQAALTTLDSQSARLGDYQQRIEELWFAEAFIRKGQLCDNTARIPLQVAVIGPTQSGKSSIVNTLLSETLAGVSPLAGFTVHPHGFCHRLPLSDCTDLQGYFGRFQQMDQALLSKSRYDCYSLQTTQHHGDALPACVLWDTPDFDSIDASDYREGVIRTIALADVLILVVSKEKYADQSVWSLLKTIEAFQQPTLICVNKLTTDSESVVLQSLAEKWRQHRSDEVPPMLALHFQKSVIGLQWPVSGQQMLGDVCRKVVYKKHVQRQLQYIQRHWVQWLQPVVAEHQAHHHWQGLVDQVLAQAAKDYQRDYLNHPYHYQTFQAALLNLLGLLEVPGVAVALSKTRRALTWPVRKLMKLGQGKRLHPSQELQILDQIGNHVLIQLADKLLESNETDAAMNRWWQETAQQFRLLRVSLLHDYQQAASDYHHDFQQNIKAAADRLYNKLQDHPLLLNSLRATRFTTDAGAMVLAIQTGGIGLHDLLITPLMLTITSLLAESAIGGYMQRVEAELKHLQLETVKNQLFDRYFKQRLYQLPLEVRSSTRFNITEQQCREAEQALKEKKHGLRLL